ncbi:reductive dehalogenase [Candidatus Thorarchaeota archaeon]|nr:MAG: reductive dehalogenase [Candidatus Thorarchaeota archaeon]
MNYFRVTSLRNEFRRYTVLSYQNQPTIIEENLMIINPEICAPTICKYECAEACNRIHGRKAPLYYTKDSLIPLINVNMCTRCLACVRACPLNAISFESDNNHQEKLRHISKTNNSPLEGKKSPYEVADDYRPMNEAQTVFARVQFDPNFVYYKKTEFFGAENMISKGLVGYGRFEHELSVAAWNLYDSRHSITRPGVGLDAEARESGNRSVTNPTELTQMIKKAAKFFGADLVGITELNRDWLYTHDRRGKTYDIPDTINRAIVMAIEMDYDAIGTSPTFTSAAATGFGYSMMAFIESELVSFVKRLGYNALPCGNDVALSVPLAIDAGLGQYGRHGLLITKPFGPRVRIAKVLTDMPLITDGPDLVFSKAVIRFCETCEKCAKNCPSQSIPYGTEQTWDGKTISNNRGVRKWFVDVESCYGFWIENGSECSNCIRSCPYNKKDGILHRSVMWIVQYLPILNRFIVKMDDVVGYGKQKKPDRFWKKMG